jgi:hypothetical protein
MSQTRISNLPAILGSSLDPDFAFPVESSTGSGPTQKITLAQIAAFVSQASGDFTASINGRLQVKDPVDQLVTEHVDLMNPYGIEEKRYALAGQLNKTQNGIYKCEGGLLTLVYPTSYFDTYGPGSLFLDKFTGRLWFIPVTKNNSNVMDPITGTRPQEAFDFMELPRTLLSLQVLDKWSQEGFSDLGYNNPFSQAHFFSFHRVFPNELLPFVVALASFNERTNDVSYLPIQYRITLETYRANITTDPAVDLSGRPWGVRVCLSDAFLLDQIETRLSPLPGGEYYGYESGPAINFLGPNGASLDIGVTEYTIEAIVTGFPGANTFSWVQVSGPNTATLSDGGTTLNVTVSDLITGSYIFQITVSDGAGTSIFDFFTLYKL